MKNSLPRGQPDRGFILRFDDIAPRMAWDKFVPLKRHVEGLSIPCLLGVVPACRDVSMERFDEHRDFFSFIRHCVSQGDTVAQHGTYHVYDSADSGLLGIQRRSEFAGHDYRVQFERLSLGKDVLVKEGVWQPYFMAPSHSFDRATLRALNALGFQALTDGYGVRPYKIEGLALIPQLTARPLFFLPGVQTLCVHINYMNDQAINDLLSFIVSNRDRFLDFKFVASWPIMNDLGTAFLRRGSEVVLRGARGIRGLLKRQ